MTDREAVLQDLADNAFIANSFTDRLVVIDLKGDAELPQTVEESLRDHGLRGANAVYATGDLNCSFAGGFGDVTRHQFVDMETRGDHQSHIVD